MCMYGAHEKVSIVFFDHVFLESLTKLLFPFVSIFGLPSAPCFSHLPIGAGQRMPCTGILVAEELVLKLEWDLL